ncbi:hypothetical protein PR048_006261 [Dryococelus australis]|uniref:Uncharacterized protein n=1 Tax=Dryococelus australis TaxID=614101 RepID=A0ABQ9IBG2_9NEOP|nr:hypothetical protein PR048_006261 [Dryococelus australis]
MANNIPGFVAAGICPVNPEKFNELSLEPTENIPAHRSMPHIISDSLYCEQNERLSNVNSAANPESAHVTCQKNPFLPGPSTYTSTTDSLVTRDVCQETQSLQQQHRWKDL